MAKSRNDIQENNIYVKTKLKYIFKYNPYINDINICFIVKSSLA